MFSLKYDLECTLKDALPTLRRSLEDFGLECDLDDEDLVQSLSEALLAHVQARLPERPPTPLPRHEECLDCDNLRDLHHRTRPKARDDDDDDDDDEPSEEEDDDWTTHCDVCWEEWPCPDAGELDLDALESLQNRYLVLRARKPDSLSPNEYRQLRDLTRRLEAEGQLPKEDR